MGSEQRWSGHAKAELLELIGKGGRRWVGKEGAGRDRRVGRASKLGGTPLGGIAEQIKKGQLESLAAGCCCCCCACLMCCLICCGA